MTLTIEGLTVRYRTAGGDVTALADVSLALAQRQKPNVIVLDLMMPVMDGFNSLESLQADPRTENIPVIVLSAMQPEQAEQRCYAMGARAYVRKPFDADMLVGIIEEIAQEHSAATPNPAIGLT